MRGVPRDMGNPAGSRNAFLFLGDTQPYAIHAEGLDVIFGGAPPPTSRESVGYRNVIRVNLDEGGTIRDNLAAAERDILAQRQFNPLCLGCNILFHEGSSFPSAFLLEAPPVPTAPEVHYYSTFFRKLQAFFCGAKRKTLNDLFAQRFFLAKF